MLILSQLKWNMKRLRAAHNNGLLFTNSAWIEHIHNANDIPVYTEFKVQTGCEMFLKC